MCLGYCSCYIYKCSIALSFTRKSLFKLVTWNWLWDSLYHRNQQTQIRFFFFFPPRKPDINFATLLSASHPSLSLLLSLNHYIWFHGQMYFEGPLPVLISMIFKKVISIVLRAFSSKSNREELMKKTKKTWPKFLCVHDSLSVALIPEN